ncbi:DNA polymerase III subunit delta' [Qipengyuania sp. 6D47A]|uniref:DNA polymerase III subunit delta n=1 Tax=Qipengyuania qiaonensis TaxID=2867240 RepID=A0ABS7J1P5_9SPHN|nr:DNA polymerase III subunit delta' [Qipengyuania qiaonensis]MBX7481255.1 DNA polymerase III subunit delta' [Qipengyuania qiaonensis]
MIGHEEAWREWRRAMAGERMHHAWLLAGRRGVGKASFALAAARQLVATGNAQTEQHPDIHMISYAPKDDKEERKRAEGKPFELARSIRIAQIRAMQSRLSTRPTLGDRRAIIIDPADDLERNAANALLKSLEEPPAGTYFLLVAHSPARLLPTIRSRCRVLRFPTVSDMEMDNLLQDLSPAADEATRAAAIAAAAGSPGAAREFVDMELGSVAQAMRDILDRGDPDFRLRGTLAGLIGARPDRDRIRAVLELARSVVAQRLEANMADPRRIIDTHSELVRLTGEQPTYNFDAGLLAMEIGTLLANAAKASERADG